MKRITIVASPSHMHITVNTGVTFPPAAKQSNVNVMLLDTRFFSGQGNVNFVGDAYAFSTTNPPATLRFDPEGVRISDNDLTPTLETQIYAFAIDGSASGANIDYQPQDLPEPLFPPGQVKKALR